MRKIWFCFCLCIFLFGISFGQTMEEIQNMRVHKDHQTANAYFEISRDNNSEFELFAGFLFRFYKKHISSQDMGKCVFEPSCSEYALLAIKKQGFIIGTLNSFDRLTRCNNDVKEYYLESEKNGLLADPVRNILYEEK